MTALYTAHMIAANVTFIYTHRSRRLWARILTTLAGCQPADQCAAPVKNPIVAFSVCCFQCQCWTSFEASYAVNKSILVQFLFPRHGKFFPYVLCAVEVELYELHLVSRAWNIAAAAEVVFVMHTLLVEPGDGELQRSCALIEAKITHVCLHILRSVFEQSCFHCVRCSNLLELVRPDCCEFPIYSHLSMQSSHFASVAR